MLELVDAAIPLKQLDPVKQTILQIEGVKVSSILALRDYVLLGVGICEMLV